MNAVSVLFLVTGIVSLIFSGFILGKIHCAFEHMNQMLDQAIAGNFEEKNYNESQLSRLEAKLFRFLSVSRLSLHRLEEQKNQIQQTVSDLSHQTKTPLANLLFYTEYLSEKELAPEEETMVLRIGEQAEKLNFLIQSLIKISRLEHDLIKVHCKPHSLSEFLVALSSMYQKKAEEKGIRVKIKDTKAQACFDEKWTLEAVGNILDNAIKYTDSGGSVWMEVKEYELFLVIEVKDTGIGISEEELTEIFTRFYRSPKVSCQQGVGIGLYLTRKIISLQGGYLKVSSKEGKGTTFQVYLPKNHSE